ncbi:unnamed protein product [Rhizopus stolonifer]
MRRFIVRIRYLRMLDLISRLQRVARQKMGVQKIQVARQTQAAIKIQAEWRRYIQRKRYLRQCAFIVHLQAVCRAHAMRLKFSEIRQHFAAIKIQSLVRGWAVRREYKAKRNHVIALQTCIRLRLARQRLQSLKREAKSANHFKEVSYKLESKVVELTQSVTQHKEEKQQMRTKATELELQIKSWTEKYEKLDKKAKDLEQKLDAPNELEAELELIKNERATLQTDYRNSLERIKKQESEINRLSEDLDRQKEEIFKLKQQSNQQQLRSPVSLSGGGPSLAIKESEVAELKGQIASLKAQLQSHKNNSKRQASMNTHRTLSPQRDRRGISPDSNRSPSVDPRAASPSNMRRSSLVTAVERVENKVVYAEPEQMIPKKIGQRGSLEAEKISNPEDVISQLLQENGDELEDELIEGLIQSLKIVPPGNQNLPSREEVFFPVHIIGRCVTQMWRLGYLAESERLLLRVMGTLQKDCVSFTGEETIVPCAYWLSNTHELLSLVYSVERELETEMHYNSIHGRRAVGWHDFEKLVSNMKFELQCLQDNIYFHWLSELKKKLNKMAIPALIETQSLPGFIASDSTRFFNNILPRSQPAFSMDDLLNFMNRIHRTMNTYYVDPDVIEQVLTELLKLIGITTFNDLVMRRNFNSWKRAMQIQYNITRLEEWCKAHEAGEAITQLEHLTQATKLLQLKKGTLKDIQIIYDVCWFLAPTQVQKLIQNYCVADYEDPINNEILRAVASRVSSSDTEDILLLDNISLEESDYDQPEPHNVEISSYVPDYLNIQQVQKLIALTNLLEQRKPQRMDSI